LNAQDRWGRTALSDALHVKSAVAAHLLHTFGASLGTIVPPGVPPTQKFIELAMSDNDDGVDEEEKAMGNNSDNMLDMSEGDRYNLWPEVSVISVTDIRVDKTLEETVPLDGLDKEARINHQMFPECHQMFPECHQMCPECHQMFPECHQMFPQCHQMFPECHSMFPESRKKKLRTASKKKKKKKKARSKSTAKSIQR
jgi:hypothetical protein